LSIVDNHNFEVACAMKSWMVPIYWSEKFNAHSAAEQKEFLKFKGFVFDATNFDYVALNFILYSFVCNKKLLKYICVFI